MKTVKALKGESPELMDFYFYLSNNFLMAVPTLVDGTPDTLDDSVIEEWVALDELSH